jgi:glycosyltransferase involved in cell wall biosynthesis
VTLLEAMAAKVPVVVTRVGGVPDVVGPAEAMLVPPEDPIALANAIHSVIQDRAGALRRAEAAARRLHTNFGIEAWIDAHDRLYDIIASIRNGRRALQRS